MTSGRKCTYRAMNFIKFPVKVSKINCTCYIANIKLLPRLNDKFYVLISLLSEKKMKHISLNFSLKMKLLS